MATHILHYNTHAEKRYFLGKNRHHYDLIALNGNIVSHTPQGIAGFISTAAKKYYIDPQTHAFQHATIHLKRKKEDNTYEFKPSIEKLAKKRLGSVFSEVIVEDRPLRPTNFLSATNQVDEKIIEEICHGVVEFQLNFLSSELDEETKEFMGDADLSPSFIVAPYFFLAPHSWKDWVLINAACYKKTKELYPSIPVFAGLVLSKELISNNELISFFSSFKPDGILLWIDEHDEGELSSSDTQSYLAFLKELRGCTKTIYNIHGGYLSILLCHSGFGPLIDGVGHAVNYGEHRAVVPIGGGIPMARFYFLSVHSRLRYADALGIALSKGWLSSISAYKKNVCKCKQCHDLVKVKGSAEAAFEAYGESNTVTFSRRGGIVRLDYPTSEAKQYATRHYLFCKYKEFTDLTNVNHNTLVRNLKESYDDIVVDYHSESLSHLPCWFDALADADI